MRAFQALPLPAQQDLLWAQGTFVHHRLMYPVARTSYHMPGRFFVEVTYQFETPNSPGRVLEVTCYAEADRLDWYAACVALELPGAPGPAAPAKAWWQRLFTLLSYR